MFAFFFLRYKDKKFFLKTQSFKKEISMEKKAFYLITEKFHYF